MPPTPKPLTLIVATTPIPQATATATATATTTTTSETKTPNIRFGIGRNGTLPWPRIKTDMSFFARVTSCVLQPQPHSTNAIIMGRKTYESVPAHLRPLGKRISAVITRDTTGVVQEQVRRELEAKRRKEEESRRVKKDVHGQSGGGGDGKSVVEGETDAIVCSGLEGALETLEGRGDALGGLWVIGGAEIYGAALRLKGVMMEGRKVRIVMTNVERRNGEAFECDTFFPLDDELLNEKGWKKVSGQEVSEWVGETVTGEWIEEGDVRVQMVGYERVD